MQVICLWSGPRNVSTALMYSFAQRSDTAVVDEPLYGHYLRVSGSVHPGGDDVMSKMNCDGDAVMKRIMTRQQPEPLLFIKHMAHHLRDLDLSFMKDIRNVFLIRDPLEMLPSLTVQIPHAGLADTGLKRQWELFDDLANSGRNPAVIDSRELLLNPRSVLAQLCAHLGIDFDEGMLSWPPGPLDEDGVWAEHWYHSVHKSTGFSEYVAKSDFPDALLPMLEECRPWYDKLYSRAFKARPEKEDLE